MLFNITKFKEAANKAMAKGNISQNTAKLYLYCLNTLNDVLEEGASSEEIKNAIMDRGNSAEAFRDAVSFYERKVKGFAMMTPTDRTSIKVEQQVRELDYSPRYYRDRIRKAKNRFAFTIQERAGLRVSEVCSLTPEDITVDGENITINVRHGKGNKQRYVHCLPSQYLLKEIPNFEKMPSLSVLRTEAWKLGFRTHDLRKVNARARFWIEREKGKTRKQSLKAIKDELGHVSPSETLRYVGKEYDKKKNNLKF